MEPRIVDRPGTWVLGVMTRINPMSADYGDLWRNGYMPRHAEIQAYATSPACCGMYFGTDEEGKVDFVAGMPVTSATDAPPGLTLREAPAGPYAEFECTMATIRRTWGEIQGWFIRSPYVDDESRPSIEEYDAELSGPAAPVKIVVPVKPR